MYTTVKFEVQINEFFSSNLFLDFHPSYFLGRLAPGYPPVHALHGASLRVQSEAKQLASSPPIKKPT
jgi:hypothetical protein